MFFGVSESYDDRTKSEGSDIAFRGVTQDLLLELIGLTIFGQFEDKATGTLLIMFTEPDYMLTAKRYRKYKKKRFESSLGFH